MAKIHILAGDFLQGEGEYCSGAIIVESELFPWPGARINADQIRSVSLARDMITALDKTLAHCLPGGLILRLQTPTAAPDPAQVTFWITLKDGRRLLGSAHESVYLQLEQQVAAPGFFSSHE